MSNGNREFSIDYERLKEISARAYHAYEDGRGIFKHKERFLPQWAIPPEIEYEPQMAETRLSNRAGNYLFVLASMEKKSQTKQNIKNGLKTWANPETRWIFSPEEVVQRNLREIKQVLSQNLRYTINNFSSNFLSNNHMMVDEYEGYAKNIIDGQTVEESRRRLMMFKGIGTGIANLYIIYCTDRQIAQVQDPEEMRLKVDIHKARVPTNTNAVLPANGRVRRDLLVPALEASYLQVCRDEGFNRGRLDSALWLIGSQICVKKDMAQCVSLCPLEKLCVSCVREDNTTGELVVLENGRRVETRKGVEQFHLNVGLYPE